MLDVMWASLSLNLWSSWSLYPLMCRGYQPKSKCVADSQWLECIKTTPWQWARPFDIYFTLHRILGTGLVYMHTVLWCKRFVACSSWAHWLLTALLHSPTCFHVILFQSSSDEYPLSTLSSVECIVCPLDTLGEKSSGVLSCVNRIRRAESTA